MKNGKAMHFATCWRYPVPITVHPGLCAY